MQAEVVVNRPTQRRPRAGEGPLREAQPEAFTYRLPERLAEVAVPGHLVQVPLQAGLALGVVVDLTVDGAREGPTTIQRELREVAEIVDPQPVVTGVQIALARWLAAEYLAPLSQVLRMMLPPGLEERTMVVISGREGGDLVGLGPEAAEMLRRLRARRGRPGGQGHRLPRGDKAQPLQAEDRQDWGPVRLAALLSGTGDAEAAEAALQELADRGLVETRTALVTPHPAPARVQWVRLLADERALRAALPWLGRPSKQADVLMALARRAEAPLSLAELCQRVGCTASPVEALAARGWVEVSPPQVLVVAVPGEAAPAEGLARAPQQAAALAALRARGGQAEWKQFRQETGVSSAALGELEKRGLVRRVTEPAWVLLRLPVGEVLPRVLELRGGEKERAVLEALRSTTSRVWVGGLYAETGANLTTLQALAGRGLISLHSEQVDHPQPAAADRPPQLSAGQEAVWREVCRGLDWQQRGEPPFVALLHGVTGSGKTEIYLRAIEAVLAAGRRAMVLVPEISLTAQTVRRFEARFPGRVAEVHGRLTLGQRYAVWDRLRRGETDVLVGPRSALLAPMSAVGLIVVDEAHDGSYKQDEPIPGPAWHAADAAVALGALSGAAVLLGSATPDVVSYWRAAHRSQGHYRLLELPPRGPAALPPVHVVDLRQELQAGNRSILSRALHQALTQTLAAGEQAILFLNRRGSATFVLCRDCGTVVRCPRCAVPLALHRGSDGGDGLLVCHRCNHRQPVPERCPACGSRRIRYFGLGTERVEAALKQAFPQARVLRWERDTAAGADQERHLQSFVEHRADVLVGTQAIAKGLNLPLVRLVGVISADTALDLPDYRAAERTFQLLTQVVGRAGRGGRAIIQTYHPEHYAIQAAAGHDYGRFYREELGYRRLLGYPPMSRLVALRYYDADRRRCQAEVERVARWLQAEMRRLEAQAELIGPAPCFFERAPLEGQYRWQLVVRMADPLPLLRGVAWPRGWRVDVDPVSLL